jgi:NitT/TauT family transport system substrate-binding protein
MPPITRRSLFAAGASLAAVRPALAQGMTELKVSLNAPYDGSNAAFFLAEQRGYYSAAGLHCQFDTSGGAVESVGRIGTGVYDFAFTDLNVLIDFAAKNPDKAPRDVFMLYYRSPFAVITFAKSGIAKASDLAGKTLGAAITDGAYRLFPAYCNKTGLDPNSVKFKFVDLRLRETLLLRGEVDAILGFDSTSYFNLVKAGAKPETVKFVYYADADMPIYGNSLAASKKMLDGSPDVVKRFVAASAHGWMDAIKDPDAAIAALARKDSLVDVKLETEKLNWVIKNQIYSPESRANGIGPVDAGRLASSIGIVQKAFELPLAPAPGAVFDTSFMPPADQRKLPA